jgi:membrane fusion protein, multidrug efflux system
MNEHVEYSRANTMEAARVGTRALQGRRRRVVLWAAALLIVLAAIVWIIHHGKQVPGGAQGSRGQGSRGGASGPVAVAVATATVGEIAVKVPALGTVTPLATVTVKTQISGQLQRLAFKEGQVVQRGDFLAQIDPRPYQATLDQAQGNLRRDQALLANAHVDLKRYQGLAADNTIAKQQLDTQQTLVQQYEATVATDEAQVTNARLNLQYTHIVAPIAGRLGLRQVDQGNYVTPGDANGIVVVTQLHPVSVVFPVPEDYLPAIQKRLQTGAVLSVEAYDRANTTKLADGTLQAIDNEIDTNTGTIKMRAQFDNQDGALFANQFVNIRLLQETLRDQVIIATAAVQHGAPNGANSTFVYLVNADSRVSVQPISLGTSDGERVAVAAGIKAGDIVVTEGGDRLRDGATVALPAATSATPQTDAPLHKRNDWHRRGAGAAPGPAGAAQQRSGKPPGGTSDTP